MGIKTVLDIKSLLSHIVIPKHSEDQGLYSSLKSMQNCKSLGNNGLTKGCYKTFWNKLKDIFVYYALEANKK